MSNFIPVGGMKTTIWTQEQIIPLSGQARLPGNGIIGVARKHSMKLLYLETNMTSKFDIISNFNWRYLLKVSIRFFVWTLHIFRLELLFNKVISITIGRFTPYCQQFLKFLCFVYTLNFKDDAKNVVNTSN